ncbi:hypothetical protein N2152v2_007805 [Parachlorella kessleri]
MDTVPGGLPGGKDVGGVPRLLSITVQSLSPGQLPAMGPTPAMVNTVWGGSPLGGGLAGAVPCLVGALGAPATLSEEMVEEGEEKDRPAHHSTACARYYALLTAHLEHETSPFPQLPSKSRTARNEAVAAKGVQLAQQDRVSIEAGVAERLTGTQIGSLFRARHSRRNSLKKKVANLQKQQQCRELTRREKYELHFGEKSLQVMEQYWDLPREAPAAAAADIDMVQEQLQDSRTQLQERDRKRAAASASKAAVAGREEAKRQAAEEKEAVAKRRRMDDLQMEALELRLARERWWAEEAAEQAAGRRAMQSSFAAALTAMTGCLQRLMAVLEKEGWGSQPEP